MEWKSIAGALIKAGAPVIGTAIGGPIGGVIAGTAGKIVADALGVDNTPEAVNNAIQTDPAAADKLAAAEAKWNALAEEAKANAADRTAQSQAVNQSIQAEIGRVSWWHWRHLLGYVPVAIGIEMAALLPLVVLGKVTAADMTNSLGALTAPLTLFCGLLGYVASDTTRRTTAAMGAEPQPTLADTLVKTVKAAVTGKKIGKPLGSRD